MSQKYELKPFLDDLGSLLEKWGAQAASITLFFPDRNPIALVTGDPGTENLQNAITITDTNARILTKVLDMRPKVTTNIGDGEAG